MEVYHLSFTPMPEPGLIPGWTSSNNKTPAVIFTHGHSPLHLYHKEGTIPPIATIAHVQNICMMRPGIYVLHG